MAAPIYLISLVIAAWAEFSLAGYVLIKAPRSNVHQLAAARNILIGFFALFSIFFYSAATYENAILWNKIRAIPFIFIPILIFFFTWVWTQKKHNRISQALPHSLLAVAILFEYFNFTTNLLGYPVQNSITAWISVIAGDSFWPITFFTLSIILIIFTVILSIFHYFNIKEAAERDSQLLILLAVPIVAIPLLIMGLLAVSFQPDFLIYVPFCVLAVDILTAIGLTSKKVFLLNFASAFYPIIQSMNEAVILVDLEYLICGANAAFCRLAE